ncbi:MAG: hypothetical protein AB7O66_19665 [Limisphaerales bacterium]
MKKPFDPTSLVDDVLAESVEGADALTPLLRTVRARKRRRQLMPVVGAAMAAALFLFWWLGPGVDSREAGGGNGTVVAKSTAPAGAGALVEAGETANHALPTIEVATQPVTPVVEDRIRSTAVGPDMVLRTKPDPQVVQRLSTGADASLRLSDDELLQMAGGRGVALARLEDGRKQLLFAGASSPWPESAP